MAFCTEESIVKVLETKKYGYKTFVFLLWEAITYTDFGLIYIFSKSFFKNLSFSKINNLEYTSIVHIASQCNLS